MSYMQGVGENEDLLAPYNLGNQKDNEGAMVNGDGKEKKVEVILIENKDATGLSARFNKFKSEHKTAWKVIKYTAIILLIHAVLAGAALLAIHFTGGFDHFAQWLNSPMTVGQGLYYFAAPIIGGEAFIALSILFGPKAVKAIKAKYDAWKTEQNDKPEEPKEVQNKKDSTCFNYKSKKPNDPDQVD